MLKYLAALANPAAFMHVLQFYRQLLFDFLKQRLKLQSQTVKYKRNKSILNYTHKHKKYSMLLDISNGPPKHFVHECLLEDGTNLTTEFCEWAGPNFDFHKDESITAGMFCSLNGYSEGRLYVTIDEKTAVIEPETSLYQMFVTVF